MGPKASKQSEYKCASVPARTRVLWQEGACRRAIGQQLTCVPNEKMSGSLRGALGSLPGFTKGSIDVPSITQLGFSDVLLKLTASRSRMVGSTSSAPAGVVTLMLPRGRIAGSTPTGRCKMPGTRIPPSKTLALHWRSMWPVEYMMLVRSAPWCGPFCAAQQRRTERAGVLSLAVKVETARKPGVLYKGLAGAWC